MTIRALVWNENVHERNNPVVAENYPLGIHGQVAGRLDLEIEEPVPRDLGEHVLEERQSGRKLGAPRAIEVQRQPDLRLVGIPDYRGRACAAHGVRPGP